jgi:hypothetical protein
MAETPTDVLVAGYQVIGKATDFESLVAPRPCAQPAFRSARLRLARKAPAQAPTLNSPWFSTRATGLVSTGLDGGM